MKKLTKLMSALSAAVLGVALLGGSPAFAKEANPCAEDIAKFCKDVQPGEGRVSRCLKEHKDEVSPSCKNRMDNPSPKKKSE